MSIQHNSTLVLVSIRRSWCTDTPTIHFLPLDIRPSCCTASLWPENHSIAFPDVPQIHLPFQHYPDPRLVFLLSMVVQRGLCVVCGRSCGFEMDSGGKVRSRSMLAPKLHVDGNIDHTSVCG